MAVDALERWLRFVMQEIHLELRLDGDPYNDEQSGEG